MTQPPGAPSPPEVLDNAVDGKVLGLSKPCQVCLH
jgi:hypothetical protein